MSQSAQESFSFATTTTAATDTAEVEHRSGSSYLFGGAKENKLLHFSVWRLDLPTQREEAIARLNAHLNRSEQRIKEYHADLLHKDPSSRNPEWQVRYHERFLKPFLRRYCEAEGDVPAYLESPTPPPPGFSSATDPTAQDSNTRDHRSAPTDPKKLDDVMLVERCTSLAEWHRRAMEELRCNDQDWAQYHGVDVRDYPEDLQKRYNRAVAHFHFKWSAVLTAVHQVEKSLQQQLASLQADGHEQLEQIESEYRRLRSVQPDYYAETEALLSQEPIVLTVIAAHQRLECRVEVSRLVRLGKKIRRFKRDIMYKAFGFQKSKRQLSTDPPPPPPSLSSAETTLRTTTVNTGTAAAATEDDDESEADDSDGDVLVPVSRLKRRKDVSRRSSNRRSGNEMTMTSSSSNSGGDGLDSLIVGSSREFSLFIDQGPRMEEDLLLSVYRVRDLPVLWLKRINLVLPREEPDLTY